MELRDDLPGGRRQLSMRVGPFHVRVREVPGRSLSKQEWADVVLSRRSYTAMWGGDGDEAFLADPHDGRGDDAKLFDVRHYLAWIKDEAGGPSKLVTMRKVRVVPEALTAAQREDPFALLPLDVRFWRVAGDGRFTPLWEALCGHLRGLAGDEELAEFRFAAVGRTATFPFAEPDRSARGRERTAIAFACIQILAALGDASRLWIGTLRPKLPDRVLGVRDVNGAYVTPEITRTEEVLGLARGSVGLANDLEIVRRHKSAHPGYFLDHADAARLLRELLDEGLLTVADLAPAMLRLVEQQAGAGVQPAALGELAGLIRSADHHRLADVLTRPRAFRALIPLIAGSDRTARMSAPELRRRLLDETADGPFSATLLPARWAASAWRVLDRVNEKYTGSGVDRGDAAGSGRRGQELREDAESSVVPAVTSTELVDPRTRPGV